MMSRIFGPITHYNRLVICIDEKGRAMKKGKCVLAHLAGRERIRQLSGAGTTFGIRLCIGQVLGVSQEMSEVILVKDLAYDFKVCATVNTSVVGLNIMNFINARYIVV